MKGEASIRKAAELRRMIIGSWRESPPKGVKWIPAKCGAKITVDESDFKVLSKYFWSVGSHGYATGSVSGKNKLLHRVLTECPQGMEVDHVNGNRLDNRRSNLRICSRLQNAKNGSGHMSKPVPFKGVFRAMSGRWRAQIKSDGVLYHLGVFDTPEIAAEAYDMACLVLNREFARTNKYE